MDAASRQAESPELTQRTVRTRIGTGMGKWPLNSAGKNRLAGLALLAVLGVPARAQVLPPASSGSVDFSRDIKPLFDSRCQVCHGSAMQQSGLRLDSRQAAMQGGYSGPVILPHNSADSRLVQMVAGTVAGVVMPPLGERLTDQEVGLVRAWIDQGAIWPEEGTLVPPTSGEKDGHTHWAYRPPRKPPLPRVRNSGWVQNPIDRFVLASLERESIEPSPPADRYTLIRRLSLDLVGLPPTPREVADFLVDRSPQAYERVVDRLLRSPHYGEKWAMHWLDLARYADSDGYEKDLVRPHAWRYRHWVINALNDDMPFDRFTTEQIAGDLLEDGTIEQKVATGFHRNTLKNREGGVNIEQFRFEEVVDRASTVGTVWMGLTVGCAQCHDHKFDPITQKDYYSLFAFFNDADEVNVDAPLAGEMGPYLAGLPAYRKKRQALLEKNRVFELMPAWEEGMRQAARHPGRRTDWDHAYDALGKYLDNGHGIVEKAPPTRTQKEIDGITDHFVIHYHRVISKEFWKELAYKDLRQELDALRNGFPALSQAQVIARSPEGRRSHIHLRGAWDQPGVAVLPDVPHFLGTLPDPEEATRLDLSSWIVSPQNPLTARVASNRIWQEYFGAGIVRTSENFGSQGEQPSHPDLLDWLASEFVERGWSLKSLHKTIVMSATYQQSSTVRSDLQTRDPDNRLLARQSRLRLPAELIRDSALAVSGLLYPKIGGRSVRPPIPEGVTDVSYANSVKWPQSEGQDQYRRGLYVLIQRTVPYPQMANFDATAREVALCSRERSNTPLQSLNLLNDPVFMEAAQALAVRVLSGQASNLQDRLRYAFQLALARPPRVGELQSLTDYYVRQTRIFEQEPGAAEELAPLELAGVSRLETAVWTGLSSVLLNLDEFITRE